MDAISLRTCLPPFASALLMGQKPLAQIPVVGQTAAEPAKEWKSNHYYKDTRLFAIDVGECAPHIPEQPPSKWHDDCGSLVAPN